MSTTYYCRGEKYFASGAAIDNTGETIKREKMIAKVAY
jgi:hypothetical protein